MKSSNQAETVKEGDKATQLNATVRYLKALLIASVLGEHPNCEA